MDARVEKVDALREQGMPVKEACEKVGIATSHYYFKKQTTNGTSKKPKPRPRVGHVESIVVPDHHALSEPLFIVYGTPAQLAEFANQYRG